MKIKSLVIIGMMISIGCAPYYFGRGIMKKDEKIYDEAVYYFSQISESHPLFERAQKEIKEIEEIEKRIKKRERKRKIVKKKRKRKVQKSDKKEKRRRQFERHYKEGERLLVQNKFYEAYSEFKKAQAVFSNNPQVKEEIKKIEKKFGQIIGRARILFEQRKYEKVVEILEPVVRVYSYREAKILYVKSCRLLGMKYYQASKYQLALKYFQKERKYNPHDKKLSELIDKIERILRRLK